MAVAAGRQVYREGEPGVAGRIGLGGLDQIDLGAGIGRLEIGDAGRVEAFHLRMVGDDHHPGDEIGEMVGPAGDGLRLAVDRDAAQRRPVLGVGVVPVDAQISFALAVGQQPPVIRQGDGDVPRKVLARLHAVGAARSPRHVDEVRIELGDLAGRERPDRQCAARCQRAGRNIQLRPVVGDAGGGARRHQGESGRRHLERESDLAKGCDAGVLGRRGGLHQRQQGEQHRHGERHRTADELQAPGFPRAPSQHAAKSVRPRRRGRLHRKVGRYTAPVGRSDAG